MEWGAGATPLSAEFWLIGVCGGVYFHGEGQEKILLCKGGHYMKNKNTGGGGGGVNST